MAIIQLTSTNPQFSFHIKKNPNSGMQLPSNGHYQEIAMQLLFEMDKEKEIDPRL
ncbi:hypothetical protein [Paenibacillus solani]|uniref:hypothetical protein n=1 Tax=Paenibacillus solani TaxID=1705565 RepID=UPI000A533A1F|nr:hypothetical protein [Paenibacillus solani]